MAVNLKQLGSKLSYNDINQIMTLFASPEESEPEVLYDGQIWLKLTSGGPVLMRRNESLNQWEPVGEVTEENLMVLINEQAGTGSGLDADLLDGKEADEFLQLEPGGKCILVGGQDLDNVTDTGMYRGRDVINAPNSEWYYFAVYKQDNNTVMQHAFSLFMGFGFWVRIKTNGTWGSWKKIWFEGNQGPGSGLDADTLDGVEAEDFIKKNENIALNGKYISNDGQDEGISVDDSGNVSFSGNAKVGRFFNIGEHENLIVSNGEITVSKSYYGVKGEEGETSVDLNTINGGEWGDILILQASSVLCPVTVKDNVGNIRLAGDFVLQKNHQKLMLIAMDFSVVGGGLEWHELSRSAN